MTPFDIIVSSIAGMSAALMLAVYNMLRERRQ